MSLLTISESQRCGMFSTKRRLLKQTSCQTAFITKNFHNPNSICALQIGTRALQHMDINMNGYKSTGIFKNKPKTLVNGPTATPGLLRRSTAIQQNSDNSNKKAPEKIGFKLKRSTAVRGRWNKFISIILHRIWYLIMTTLNFSYGFDRQNFTMKVDGIYISIIDHHKVLQPVQRNPSTIK